MFLKLQLTSSKNTKSTLTCHQQSMGMRAVSVLPLKPLFIHSRDPRKRKTLLQRKANPTIPLALQIGLLPVSLKLKNPRFPFFFFLLPHTPCLNWKWSSRAIASDFKAHLFLLWLYSLSKNCFLPVWVTVPNSVKLFSQWSALALSYLKYFIDRLSDTSIAKE